MSTERKYRVPSFLNSVLDQAPYQRWLGRKAAAHYKRDRKRGNDSCTRESYMIAIHAAVQRSTGMDEYTGLALDWALVSTYDNLLSKAGGRVYKRGFGNLPTVDHVGDGLVRQISRSAHGESMTQRATYR
jgi:hypothetical protein